MRGLGVATWLTGVPAALVALAGVSGVAGSACRTRAPCTGAACAAACPRDATKDASGRCACRDGTVSVLGSCVSPTVADAYCMAPARSTSSGACSFPVCASTEILDTETGCLALTMLSGGGPRACPADAALVVDARRATCVPRDAACPRGTHGGGTGCTSPVSCPPGSLPRAGACVPLVTSGAGGVPRVDVGAWAAFVLGIDHGEGTDVLCRPLAARPAAFGVPPGDSLTLGIRVALAIPDQDVSRVSAAVSVVPAAGHPLPAAGAALVENAVTSLVEPLRGLGGEAAAGMVEVEVRCAVASLPGP